MKNNDTKLALVSFESNIAKYGDLNMIQDLLSERGLPLQENSEWIKLYFHVEKTVLLARIDCTYSKFI